MRRGVWLGIVAAAVLCAPTATAGEPAQTRVTLDHIQLTPGGTIYTGDIFSSRKGCKNERRVYVVRKLDGPDDTRGSTLSYKGSAQPGYYWAFDEPGIPPDGQYYAKVKATAACKADRSELYSLN
jgi:hypothetical protein